MRRMVPPFETFGKVAQPGLPQVYSSRPKGIKTPTVPTVSISKDKTGLDRLYDWRTESARKEFQQQRLGRE